MPGTFLAYFRLGFGHIVEAGAMDHILFLTALAAIYRPRDWRAALAVISAFTVGHAITLTLAVLHPTTLPAPELVEFLIPVTIVATGLENVMLHRRGARDRGRTARVMLAGVFGLVHGAGFAAYLRGLFVESIGMPLAGFNAGIEAGQIVVLGAALLVFTLGERLVAAMRVSTRAPDAPFRLRMLGVSAIAMCAGTVWALQRAPW